MPRTRRVVPPGFAHHVFNRGNRRQVIFADRQDYEDFIELMCRAADRHSVPLLAYCLMPNHFHLVLRPMVPASLSAYMHWLTSTHVRRRHWRHQTAGEGHLYQERYKNIVITSDLHLITVCRYVEANPLAAGLVERAEHWPYSSLGRRTGNGPPLTPWPLPKPPDWADFVNTS